MTEHTPKQIAHAERIADSLYDEGAVDRSHYSWRIARDAALAAIVEVSELAAKVAESSPNMGLPCDLATAIRAIDPAVIGAGQLPQRADSGR